jgi:hypothetical protein
MMTYKYIFLIFFLLFACIGANAQINFNSSTPVSFLKGKDAASLPSNWMTSDYSPSGWLNGQMPYRYNVGTGGTILGDMQNNYSTVYLRSTFTATQIQDLKDVFFSVNFDDGFIVWINGEEVFSVNAPETPSYSSLSTAMHQSGTFVRYHLPAHDLSLKEGENLIAIQGFNYTLRSVGFYFDIKVEAVPSLPQTSDSLKVVFSQPSGFYNNPFDLKLDVPDPAYSIVYTIDGSNPQTSATAISGGSSKTLTINPEDVTGRAHTPCYIVRASLVKDGLAPSFPLTKTYIFLANVINQRNPGGDWPVGGSVNGQAIDLEMDPKVTDNPEYSGQMAGALTSIPSISVVTELGDLFDPATGIYVNAISHGDNWERFCSVEMIDPSGSPTFNINAGLRIRGGYSRHGNYPKHAFRLFFREEYGAPKLKFPLFDDEGTDEFDKVDLRCEQNYSWAHPNDNGARNTFVREVFSRDTQRDMGQPYTRSRYYHLYLNGMYWGLYETQERSEARYAADYLGGNKEDYDVVKVNGDFSYSIEATDGNLDSWERLYNKCSTGFANNADYFSLEGKDQNGIPKKGGEVMVNIDNMIDYMQIIFYTGNFDSPVSAFSNNYNPNNFYTLDRRDDRSSGFIFFAHDAEHTMMITQEGPGAGLYENRVQLANMRVSDFTKFQPQWLHFKLTSNLEYRQRFADKVYKNFYNAGVFTPDAVLSRFQKRVDQVKGAVVGESARWGDSQRAYLPYTYQDWNAEIQDIYTRFFPVRTNIVIDQLKSAGLYPSIDPPVIKMGSQQLVQETYPVSGNYQLSLNSAAAEIYYTLDGTDPRLVGGLINTSAKASGTSATLNLSGTSFINARVKNGDQWSALATVKLLNNNEDYSKLKVTEVHYHPTDSVVGTDIISGKSFEFIELKNTGDKPIKLAGLNFTSSIQYQFNDNDVLGPNQFYVIASKPKWFYERHFMVPSGNFQSNFSNSGEQVTISNAGGSPVIDFQYFDVSPWTTAPDGNGPSLSAAVRNSDANLSDSKYWMASTVYDGTPFADDPGIVDSIDDFRPAEYVVKVFPNPTKGRIFFKVEGDESNTQVEIFSLSGSLLYREVMSGNREIDFGRLNIKGGIYLVNIKSNESTSVHKVVYAP